MGLFLTLVVVGLLAVALYARAVPSDPERWHVQAYPSGMEPRRGKGSYVWRAPVEGDGTGQLAKLDRIIMETPRTERLTGSVASGRVTYITRSRVFGFPDYTTIGVYEGLIEDGAARYVEINARLRFGKSDLGVNANRVKGWLAQM